MKNYKQKLIDENPRAKEIFEKINSISEEQIMHNERLAILSDEEKILRDEFNGYLDVMTRLWDAEEQAKRDNMDEDVYDEYRDNLIAKENEYAT